MTQLITIRLLVGTNKSVAPQLDDAAETAVKDIKRLFHIFHMEVMGAEISRSVPTKEEAMRLVPRKIHYGMMNLPTCADKLVPNSRLTDSWDRVTCKQCLKKRSKGTQKELFT